MSANRVSRSSIPTPEHRFCSIAGAGRVLLLLLLLVGAFSASAQDWSYRVRPGDNLWDLSTRYLRSDVPWERLKAHNQVVDPYRLPPGQTLKFPIAWLRVAPAPARVIAVRGPVQVVKSDVSEHTVSEGALLTIGSLLRTGVNASVTLSFADDSRLQLREKSELYFDQLSSYGKTGMVDTRLRLQQGRSSSRVTPARGPASRFVIDAPTATSSVRGTVFRVSAGTDNASPVTEVLKGKVQVGNRQGNQLVTGGHASASPSAQRAPSVAIALLPAPTFDDSRSRLEPLPILASWRAVDGAVGYRVEVVRADAPDVLLFARDIEQPELSISDLPAGELRLLVRAVSMDGFEGLDSARDFAIPNHPLPPLTISPRDGQQLNLPRPRFEWTQAPDTTSSVLQVARTANFLDPLVEQTTSSTRYRPDADLVPGTYYWRVASRDGAGRQGRYSEALPLHITDEPVDPGLSPPEGAKGQLTLRWKTGNEGQRYRVQVDRRSDFRRPLVDQEVEQPEVTFKRPWRGKLYVRVQYIDDDGYAGALSPAQQIQLPCRLCNSIGAGALMLLLL